MAYSGADELETQRKWSHGFCSCYSPLKTCCCAIWGPCCLYGKTDTRLRDPSLRNGTYCNSSCFFFGLISCIGLYWIPLMMKRTQIRDRFAIDGSCLRDCFAACCCHCCVLTQNEKEVESRSNLMQTGYQEPAAMVYYPQ